MKRREWMKHTGTLAMMGGLHCFYPSAGGGTETNVIVKPIRGSWFEFQHHNHQGSVHWDARCAALTCRQWEGKIREMAELGLKYLVLLSVALDSKTYYPSSDYPRHPLECDDPLETALSTADRYGLKFFMSNGFFGNWRDFSIVSDPAAMVRRVKAMEELVKNYGHHPSFYGWYWPNESCMEPYFHTDYIQYVNACSRKARELTPQAKVLIAPYGTRNVVPDDVLTRQLDGLDVDIIAYQDEVGVLKSTAEETPRYFERLRQVHDRVARIALWADVELFAFEGEPYRTPAIAATFSRILRQLESVSPYVETVLVYQYQGMMDRPGSVPFSDHTGTVELYTAYRQWLEQNHPDVIRKE